MEKQPAFRMWESFWIVLTILVCIVTTSTKYGKKVYAVGSNLKGARMAGISRCGHEDLCICDLWCTGRCSSISLDCHERILRPGNNRNQLWDVRHRSSCSRRHQHVRRKRKMPWGSCWAMSYTVIDKIIVSLKMDSLINNAIKGMILLIVIMIQVAGPKIRGNLNKIISRKNIDKYKSENERNSRSTA